MSSNLKGALIRKGLGALIAAAAFSVLFCGACRVTVAPLAPTRVPAPALPSRGVLAAPAAPTVDYARTFVVAHYEGVDVYSDTVGGAAWTDLYLFWRQPDPAPVDYYEVYTTTNAPYFSVPMSATLALTTTAQGGIFLESPDRFNPVPGSAAYQSGSDFDFYVIRAVNGAGASAASAAVGVVNFSLIARPLNPGEWPSDMPTPKPTAGPSPTPVPTHTLTPVPPGTPGPSPTP